MAIQEVRGNLTALQTLGAALGPNWATIMTDVTRGRAGNNERMVFAFDLRRVKPWASPASSSSRSRPGRRSTPRRSTASSRGRRTRSASPPSGRSSPS